MEQAKEEGWWEDSGRDGNYIDWLLIGESSEREAGYDIRQGTGAVAFIAASNNRNSHNGSNGDYLAEHSDRAGVRADSIAFHLPHATVAPSVDVVDVLQNW